MNSITLDELATAENFDEAAYLDANPDVAEAVAGRAVVSGWDHLLQHGLREKRRLRFQRSLASAQLAKQARIEPLLRLDLQHVRRSGKFDFLTEHLRDVTGIAATNLVSAHGYDGYAEGLVRALSEGLVLDCGAGRRPIY